jgi:hypothetical protein
MQILSYNKLQLSEYIHSDFFKVLTQIPISYQRALSQINNPYASDEDILLWAAYQNASLIGYVGVLPDEIDLNGTKNKIYWVSCFWVSDAYRNENLASQLFFLMLKAYRNNLFLSNFLFSLEKTYQSLGVFKPTQYIYGKTFYRNLCFEELIEARFPDWADYMPFYRAAEKFINKALRFRDIFVRNYRTKFKILENNVYDKEFDIFLQNYKTNHPDKIVRSANHFDWILTYPWILTNISDQEAKRYYFSSKSNRFGYLSLKLYNKDKLEGYALLKIRDKNLAVSYLYAEDEHINCISNYISVLMKKDNFDTVTCFESRLSESLARKHNGYIYKKTAKRPYIFPKNIEINAIVFQDGDGDSVFT